MKTTKTYTDSRINRNNDFGGFCELAQEIVHDKTGINKEFKGGSMTYNEFKSTAYRHNWKDAEVDVVMDFNTNKITITVDAPERKMLKIDEEMEQWKARANDEFSILLKEINKKAFNEWFNEESEEGIVTTPISWEITAYSLDGNRKHTANVIRNIIENYDMMEDVKELVKKMMKLAI